MINNNQASVVRTSLVMKSNQKITNRDMAICTPVVDENPTYQQRAQSRYLERREWETAPYRRSESALHHESGNPKPRLRDSKYQGCIESLV